MKGVRELGGRAGTLEQGSGRRTWLWTWLWPLTERVLGARGGLAVHRQLPAREGGPRGGFLYEPAGLGWGPLVSGLAPVRGSGLGTKVSQEARVSLGA